MGAATRPVVTFLTDFGSVDEYVGCMKGEVLRRCRDAVLVDLSHGIEPGDVLRGALALQAAVPSFPEGTIHVAVVDPGVGSSRRALVVDCGTYRLVGPDNGILAPATTADASVYVLDRAEFFAAKISRTFHGRDVFGPVAGHLAAGRPARDLGTPVADMVTLSLPTARRAADGVVGEVLYADRFGNLVTTIASPDLAGLGAAPEVTLGDVVIGRLRATYSDGAKGEVVAVVGSTDRVEIAVVEGSARERFGARGGRGTRVHIAS